MDMNYERMDALIEKNLITELIIKLFTSRRDKQNAVILQSYKEAVKYRDEEKGYISKIYDIIGDDNMLEDIDLYLSYRLGYEITDDMSGTQLLRDFRLKTILDGSSKSNKSSKPK